MVPSGTMDIFEKPRRSDAASKKTVETDSSVEQKNRFKLDVRIMYMERVIETRHDMGEVDRAAEAIEAYARMVDRNARTQAVLAGCRATNAALRGDVESCDKWLAEYAALENDLPWR